MKKDIHPKYYNDAKVKCSCGNSFVVGSTLKEIQVEVCSACHPFYTGKKTTLDVAGRIEQFKKRLEKKAKLTPKKKKQRKSKQDKEDKQDKKDKEEGKEEKKKEKKTTKKKRISKKEEK